MHDKFAAQKVHQSSLLFYSCCKAVKFEINENSFFFFFNVGPLKEDIFLGHLLCPIFQSTLHITITSLCLGVDTVRFSCLLLCAQNLVNDCNLHINTCNQCSHNGNGCLHNRLCFGADLIILWNSSMKLLLHLTELQHIYHQKLPFSVM